MKKSIVLAALLAAGSLLFAAGKKETAATGTENANVSGKVVIYTSMDQDIIDAIDAELEKQ